MLVDDEEIRQKTTSCKPTQIFLWQDGLQCWSIEELKFFEIVLVQKMLRQRGAVLSAIILVLGLLGYFYFWHWSSDALLRRFNAASNSPGKLTLAVEVFSARLGNQVGIKAMGQFVLLGEEYSQDRAIVWDASKGRVFLDLKSAKSVIWMPAFK